MKRIKCLFGRHEYFVIKEYKYSSRHIGCKVCKKEWGMNDDVQVLIPWSRELEDMHEYMSHKRPKTTGE